MSELICYTYFNTHGSKSVQVCILVANENGDLTMFLDEVKNKFSLFYADGKLNSKKACLS